MIINKILGYILLALGLVLIVFALWQSYNIFTGKTSAPIVFATPSPINSSAKNSNSPDIQAQIQNQIQNVLGQQLNQVISPALITKTLNLTAWTFLAWILIMAGGAIAGIGVKLLNGN